MGSNSFFGRLAHGEPIESWAQKNVPGWKYVNPAGAYLTNKGDAYNNLHTQTWAPGPYSGVTPTLADANAGYTGRPGMGSNFTPGGYGTAAPKAPASFTLPGAQTQRPGVGMAAPRQVPSSFTPTSWG